MMKNKDKIKMKAGVLLIVWLMIVVSISSVLGGVVTNTDVSTTTTDSGFTINYPSAWIGGLENISYGFSIDGTYADRWFNDSQDSIVSFIRNSNGKYWAATGSNFILAVADAVDGTVWLPEGTIEFTSIVNDNIVRVLHSISIVGAGRDKTILKVASAPDVDWSYFLNLQASNCSIQDLTIDGNSVEGGGTFDYQDETHNRGVYCSGDNLTVDNVRFYRIPTQGLVCKGDNHIVTRCIFERSRICVCRNNTYISGNKFIHKDYGGVGSYAIEATADAGDPYVNNNTIVNNYFEDRKVGIDFNGYGGSWGIQCTKNTIDNNVFVDISSYAIWIRYDNCHDISITGNKFYNATKIAFDHSSNNILFEGNHVNNTEIKIQNNANNISIKNNFIIGDDVSVNNLIYSNGGGDCISIFGNVIKYGVLGAVYVDCDNSDISYNMIYMDGGTRGIYSSGNNVSITSNHITGESAITCGIKNDGGYHCIIKDNTIWGANTPIVNDGFDTIIKDNIGYDYSNYLATPFGTSTPYSTAFAGATWLDTLNDILFVHDGSGYLQFFANTSGDNAPSLSRIRNSNNNSWVVDGTDDDVQIQAAIDDIGTYGTVWIGCDTTITSKLDMDGRDGVRLDFENHEVTPSGDISFINFTDCNYAALENVQINVATQTGSIIEIYSDTDANRVDYLMLSNVHIDNTGGTVANYNGSGYVVYKEHNFTGIEICADNLSVVGRVHEGLFQHITIEGAHTGILIKTHDTGYVNGCTFSHIYFDQFKDSCIEFIETGSNGANLNSFYSFRSQAAVYSRYGLKDVSGNANSFYGCVMWDWSVSDSNKWAYWVGTGGQGTYLELSDLVYTTFDTGAYFYDEGLDTQIRCGFGEPYAQIPYDYIVFQNSTHTFAKRGDLNTIARSGTVVFASTDSQYVIDLVVSLSGVSSIFFKEGTYEIDAIIGDADMHDLTFIGEDKHSVIFKPKSVQLVSGMFNSDAEHNLTFKNICFDGSGATDSSVAIYFGFNSETHGLTVDNCVFIDWNVGALSRAIYINPSNTNDASKIQITNCEFHDCDYAVTLEGDSGPSIIQYADISNNYFYECLQSIYCDWIRNSTISNNRIISAIAGSDGITLDDSIDIVVDGNNIAVVDKGIIEIAGADFNGISGNVLRHSGTPLTVVGAGTISANLNVV